MLSALTHRHRLLLCLTPQVYVAAAVTPYRHLQPTSICKQPQGSYHSQRLRSSYTAFKIAVLSEIIDKQLYEERQLRRLFRAYLTHNSLADMQVVRMVIADLQVEMNVQLS
jgi:hypothetical protein